ncbi:hypothetical protein [Aeromonas caviae]
MIIKAFNLSRNGVGFFLTAMDAKTLFQLSRVERISENAEEGFQRQLGKVRISGEILLG